MKIVKIDNKFKDARGLIENITPDQPIRDILYITGEEGAVRGNHYHKKDQHYCYVISGLILYEYELEDGTKGTEILRPGDMVVNDLLEKHRFEFLTKGSFIAMATQSRKQEAYEEDTVRVEF